MSPQGCCLSPFRSHGNWGISQWLKENSYYDHLQEEQKRRSRSASSQFLGRPWNKPFSRPFLTIQRRRLLWKASMDSVRAYHTWLTLLPSAIRRMTLSVDIVYLDFNKAIVFHSVPTAKVMNICLDKWTIRWMENWLNCQVQKVFTSVRNFSSCPVMSGIPQG